MTRTFAFRDGSRTVQSLSSLQASQPVPKMERRMQMSRAVITGFYLLMGCVAYATHAIRGHAFHVLGAIAIMPMASLLSLETMKRVTYAHSTITCMNLVLDTVLTAWVIFWTGGVFSPCLPFYLTTVMAAAFRFGPRGSLLFALLAVGSFFIVALMDPGLPHTLHGLAGIGLRISILFAAAGFGIRALHQKLERYRREKSLNRQLEKTNRELASAYEDLKATQEQLLHAERLASIGRLIAGVAHEINNPASFIYGNLVHLERYLDQLKSLLALDDTLSLTQQDRVRREQAKRSIDYDYLVDDFDRALASCRNGAERIQKTVEALLNFSRFRRGNLRAVDPRQPMENALCILESRIRGGVQVLRQYGQATTVQGDPNELTQLFVNLLTNALDAVGEDGRIRVRVYPHKGTHQAHKGAIVEIQDNGPGIPPQHLEHIFDPFFTTKEVGKGTGLGLWIAYSIVKRHKGSLSVLSSPPRGTLVRVCLPSA